MGLLKEEKAHSWHPFQFYREAEEAKEPVSLSFASSDPTGAARAIIRHRKAKERFKKREREAKERAAAEKKKAAKLAYKAAEQASWMTQIEIDLARHPCVT